MTGYLWSQTWQLALLGLLILPLTKWLSKRHSHFAILCCYLLVAKALLPPTLGHGLSLFHWLENRTVASSEIQASESSPKIPETLKMPERPIKTVAPKTEDTVAHSSQGTFEAVPIRTAENTTNKKAPITPPKLPPTVPVSPNPRPTLEQLVVAIWIAGILISLLVTVRRHQQFNRLLNKAELANSEACTALLKELKTRLHIERPISVKILDGFTVPAVIGWRHHTILLPKRLLKSGSKADLKSILAHELIHIKRGDSTLSLFQYVAQLIWWFHPTIWLANREINRLREQCCDGEVLHQTDIENAAYAQALLNIAKQRSSARLPDYLPSARPSEITTQRIENLMKNSSKLTHQTPLYGWATAILLIAFVLPYARINSGTEQQGESSNDQGQGKRERPATTSNIKPRTANVPEVFPAPGKFRQGRSIPQESIYEVRREELTSYVGLGYGILIPHSEIHVQTRTEGVIKKTNLIPGSLVEKGDLLLELTNVELVAKLREAELDLKQAKAELRRRDLKAQQSQLESKATVQAAEREFETVKAEQSRKKSLFEKALISKAEFVKSEEALRQAEQSLILVEQTQALSIEQQEQERELGQLDLERASLVFETTLNKYEGLRLRSPITGTIAPVKSAQPLRVGAFIKSGIGIANLFDPKQVSIKVSYPATNIGNLTTGTLCSIIINEMKLSGQITAIYPTTDFNQKVSIIVEPAPNPNLSKQLVLGSRARVAFGIQTHTNVLTVPAPNSAILQNFSLGTYQVHLLGKDGSTAKPTVIEFVAIGWDKSGGTRIALEGDLKGGERVIIEQHHFLNSRTGASTRIQFFDK